LLVSLGIGHVVVEVLAVVTVASVGLLLHGIALETLALALLEALLRRLHVARLLQVAWLLRHSALVVLTRHALNVIAKSGVVVRVVGIFWGDVANWNNLLLEHWARLQSDGDLFDRLKDLRTHF